MAEPVRPTPAAQCTKIGRAEPRSASTMASTCAALGVSALLRRLFVLEALPLLDRVVELGVAVAQLAAIAEDLEALGEERVVAVDAGQR